MIMRLLGLATTVTALASCGGSGAADAPGGLEGDDVMISPSAGIQGSRLAPSTWRAANSSWREILRA